MSLRHRFKIAKLNSEVDEIDLDALTNVNFESAPGNGITVGGDYPWASLPGGIIVGDRQIANPPTFKTHQGVMAAYEFDVLDEVYSEFHLPQDYVPGSDLYIRAHWSHILGSDPGGAVTWGFWATHAKGYDQDSFSPPLPVETSQAPSPAQYRHQIAETVLTSPSSIVPNTLPSGDLEPGSLILVKTYLKSNSMTGAKPFCHFVGIHYQTTGVGTKEKAPNFYT